MSLPPPQDPLQFRALGLVKGVLQPIPDTYGQGLLMTEDGGEYPVTPGRVPLLKRFGRCLESNQPHWFYVNPQPRPNQVLGFSIIKILSLPESELEASGQLDDPDFEPDFPSAPEGVEEEFNIRGTIEAKNGAVAVTIQRKPQGNKHFPPLILELQGFLPGAQDHEFWDLQVEREGNELILVDGTCIMGR
jgi:hypothetical protein